MKIQPDTRYAHNLQAAYRCVTHVATRVKEAGRPAARYRVQFSDGEVMLEADNALRALAEFPEMAADLIHLVMYAFDGTVLGGFSFDMTAHNAEEIVQDWTLHDDVFDRAISEWTDRQAEPVEAYDLLAGKTA